MCFRCPHAPVDESSAAAAREQPERSRPPVILSEERHPLAFLNAPFVALIKLYQLTLSPVLGRSCRFEPTCSTYGVAAYRHHHPLRATYLTTTRILRCNPLCKGGYDPVPPVRRAQRSPD